MAWQVAHGRIPGPAPLGEDAVRIRADGKMNVSLAALKRLGIDGSVVTLFDKESGRVAVRAAQGDDSPADVLRVRPDHKKGKDAGTAIVSVRAALAGLGFIVTTGKRAKGAKAPSFAGRRRLVFRTGTDGAPGLGIVKVLEADGDDDADETQDAGAARPRFGDHSEDDGGDE